MLLPHGRETMHEEPRGSVCVEHGHRHDAVGHVRAHHLATDAPETAGGELRAERGDETCGLPLDHEDLPRVQRRTSEEPEGLRHGGLQRDGRLFRGEDGAMLQLHFQLHKRRRRNGCERARQACEGARRRPPQRRVLPPREGLQRHRVCAVASSDPDAKLLEAHRVRVVAGTRRDHGEYLALLRHSGPCHRQVELCGQRAEVSEGEGRGAAVASRAAAAVTVENLVQQSELSQRQGVAPDGAVLQRGGKAFVASGSDDPGCTDNVCC
mmetsp:Transcript_79928/g.222675  ORF Transcript_79928/g.222675 Transcript_79928/m.222675 type:complete len:267 (+) Transcript_79928:796-1596(+)